MARSIDYKTKVDNRKIVVDEELLEVNAVEHNDHALDDANIDVGVIVVEMVAVIVLIVVVCVPPIVITIVVFMLSIAVMVAVALSTVVVIVVVIVVSWKITLRNWIYTLSLTQG